VSFVDDLLAYSFVGDLVAWPIGMFSLLAVLVLATQLGG